jgi:small subunit ribosomal protein S10
MRRGIGMARHARIKLTSTDTAKLESVCNEIRDIAQKIGVKLIGPIPLPTKKLVVPTRRTPCGDGSKTWDKYEMRIHKRLIEIDAKDRVMRSIMRIRVPNEVYIEMEIK